MMQPTPSLPRRKRKRPETKDTAAADGRRSSDTEDDSVPTTKRKLKETTRPVETVKDTQDDDPTEAAPLDRPFRGKCLYQSRKCENERALKRNGKAHNLCDEHRSKQNQHQRKFDAKKYSKRKTDGSSGEEEEAEREDSDQKVADNTTAEAPPRGRTKSRAASVVKENKQKNPSLKAPRRLQTKSLSEGASIPMVMRQYPHNYETAHSSSGAQGSPSIAYMDARRPPPLQVVRAAATMGDLIGQQFPAHRHSDSYSAPEMVAAGMLVPPSVRATTVYASPRSHSMPYAFLPRPSMRSHSFDSAISRISPVGGAYPGIGGLRPLERQHEFLRDSSQHQQLTPTQVPPLGARSPKLPSLGQLPLGQSTYSYNAPLRPQPMNQIQRRHSPPHQAPSFGTSPAFLRPPPPLPRGSLLPPLAPLLQPVQQGHSATAHSMYDPQDPHRSRPGPQHE